MTEWQPIETAPKDRKFLLKYGDQIVEAEWDKDRKWFSLVVPVKHVPDQSPVWRELDHD